MCTVSFIARNNKVYLTSNRDEHLSRPSAYAPKEELINGVKVLYPKDPKAGGSWFACNEMGTVVVLLNGAFEKHESLGNYRKSRGLVVLDIIGHDTPHLYLQRIDLEGVEPFTVVLYTDLALYEMRWDGIKRHIKPLKTDEDHIWSSATLYTADATRKRTFLFERFTNAVTDLEANSIIDFHTHKGDDLENGFVIERATGLTTFSVTQVTVTENTMRMHHLDLLNDLEHSKTVSLIPMNVKA